MPAVFPNNLSTTLATGLTSGGFSITVASGDGAKFVNNYPMVVNPDRGCYMWATLSNPSVRPQTEQVRVVNVVGDVLSLDNRSIAGTDTESRAWPAGTVLEVRLCQEALRDVLVNQASNQSNSVRLTGTYNGPPSGFTTPDSSFSVGDGIAATRPRSWNIFGVPMLMRDAWYGSVDITNNGMTACEAIVSTGIMDLGNRVPWASGGSYIDGDVVRPTTDDGRQYTFFDGLYTPSATPNARTGQATEPNWSASGGFGGGIAATTDNKHWWVDNGDLNTGLEYRFGVDDNFHFYPSEMGFICQKYNGVTAAPFISIGKDAANPTSIVNNVQLSTITAANMRQRFTSMPDIGLTRLNIKVNTKATGTNSQFMGRFYFKGMFVQTRG